MVEYDLVVIGAGSGGLTAAETAVQLGVKVALVEKDRIGGDCTWTGCVPSKALVKVASVAHQVRTSAQYGVHHPAPRIDMAQVRAYIQGVIHEIAEAESADVLQAKGIDVIMGAARFIDPQTIQVDDRQIRARQFILSTGAHPWIPPIPGLDSVPYLTYEQIFDLDHLPERLVILGAGPVGCEIGQSFQRLGAQVTLIDERILPREEPEVPEVLGRVFDGEGLRFVGCLESVVRREDDEIVVIANDQEIRGDALLVATGRRPNVSGLALERAGVVYDDRGIGVDTTLRTSVGHIYAVGDCLDGPQFTHYAGLQAFQAVRNALLPGSGSGLPDPVAWTTFTDPAVAHIGLTEAQARQRHGESVQIAQAANNHIDRSLIDNDRDGFIKIVHHKGKILGVTIVAAQAGELINEFSLAMSQGIGLAKIASAMHVYPTLAFGVQLLAAEATIEPYLSGITGKVVRGLVRALR